MQTSRGHFALANQFSYFSVHTLGIINNLYIFISNYKAIHKHT